MGFTSLGFRVPTSRRAYRSLCKKGLGLKPFGFMVLGLQVDSRNDIPCRNEGVRRQHTCPALLNVSQAHETSLKGLVQCSENPYVIKAQKSAALNCKTLNPNPKMRNHTGTLRSGSTVQTLKESQGHAPVQCATASTIVCRRLRPASLKSIENPESSSAIPETLDPTY